MNVLTGYATCYQDKDAIQLFLKIREKSYELLALTGNFRLFLWKIFSLTFSLC